MQLNRHVASLVLAVGSVPAAAESDWASAWRPLHGGEIEIRAGGGVRLAPGDPVLPPVGPVPAFSARLGIAEFLQIASPLMLSARLSLQDDWRPSVWATAGLAGVGWSTLRGIQALPVLGITALWISSRWVFALGATLNWGLIDSGTREAGLGLWPTASLALALTDRFSVGIVAALSLVAGPAAGHPAVDVVAVGGFGEVPTGPITMGPMLLYRWTPTLATELNVSGSWLAVSGSFRWSLVGTIAWSPQLWH